MKTANVENIVFDEVHQRKYIVMAKRVLTDGEMFSAIRIALLKRGRRHPAKGETLSVIAPDVS